MVHDSRFRPKHSAASEAQKKPSFKRIISYLFFVILLGAIVTSYYFLTAESPIRVAVLGQSKTIQAESSASLAFDWLQRSPSFDPNYLSFNKINEEQLSDVDIIWFHEEDSLAFKTAVFDPSTLNVLKSYLADGGKLLLSQEAALFVSVLGLEDNPPDINYLLAEDGGYGRKMGLHSFLSHPVFAGLHGGAFIFGPKEDVNCRQIGYFGDNIPQNGKTIAVDWAYIQLKEASRLMLEFDVKKGKVISIGAYMLLGMENQQHEQMNQFLANTLDYLSGSKHPDLNYWASDKPEVVQENAELDSRYIYEPDTAWVIPDLAELPQISSLYGGDNYMEVSGKRMLIMGLEKGGIEEIWAHPFMALRDYEIGISFDKKDSIHWLSSREPNIRSYPGIFFRQYKFGKAELREWLAVDPGKSQAIMRYEYSGVRPAMFHLRFRSNLRRMWPYSEKTTGDVTYAWDDAANAFIVKNDKGDMVTMLGSSTKPDWKHLGNSQEEAKIPLPYPENDKFIWGFSGAASYPLETNEVFYFVLTATSAGEEKAKANYIGALGDPQKIFVQARNHSIDLLNTRTIVNSPDSSFNEAYKWALLATDKFLVDTPGLGTALVAGYASSAHGWDGAQEVSGRPGYAWYFGRDGQWSSMALLDYGDFENVRKQLEFYLNFQDVDGKIFHEVSTSGVVHYDAADATPLFLVLAGKYLKHSGDLEFIRQHWFQIEKALNFCYSTDVNKDKLIENVNVGHGWVEGGGLYGSQSTLYLASSWAAALEASAYMAKALGKDALEEQCSNDEKEVRQIINRDFWNKKTNFFNHGKYPDGSFNPEFTVMPAIPLYFGQIDKEKISPVLAQFAGNGFSSDWGVRIVPESSKLFNPHGYHTGSVWPLYTGWTAMAEYEGGNYLQGFQHIMNNLNINKYWGRGYIEEVLDGLVYQPSGVCRHQCWSETMALQPLLEGMLGFKPDAVGGSLELSPRLPAQWESFNVENLWLGSKNISLAMMRDSEHTRFNIKSDTEAEITLNFSPVFPPGTEFGEITWLRQQVAYKTTQEPGGFIRLALNMTLAEGGELKVNHSGGIALLPLIPEPKPGETSRGFRILNHELTGDAYVLNFEGNRGSTEIFKLYCPDWEVSSVEGAELLNRQRNIYTYRMTFDPGEGYQHKEIRVQLVK